MSVEMNGALVLVALLIPLGLAAAVVTMPRWLIRSIGKHVLWRLRDDVVDDTLAGRLPAEHPAVRELIVRVEWAIHEAESFDFLRLWVCTRAWRRVPADTARKLLERIPPLAGLPDEKATRVQSYRMRYNNVAIRTIFLSSWSGMAVVVRFAVPAGIQAFRNRARKPTLRGVVRIATDEVATETDIGRSAREFVTNEGPPPEREAALV